MISILRDIGSDAYAPIGEVMHRRDPQSHAPGHIARAVGVEQRGIVHPHNLAHGGVIGEDGALASPGVQNAVPSSP